MKNELGLTILNHDYQFKLTKVKALKDFIFIFTETNEIIVYKNKAKNSKNDKEAFFEKKFILFTKSQMREEIFDTLIVKMFDTLFVFKFSNKGL